VILLVQYDGHMMWICSAVWSYVYYVFMRRMLKWCLRILTGKCELQRITDAHHAAPASRVFAVG